MVTGGILYLVRNYTFHNHLKGWHNRLKRVLRKAHPNLLELLKKKQAASEVAIEQLAGGGKIRSQPRKVAHHKELTWEGGGAG